MMRMNCLVLALLLAGIGLMAQETVTFDPKQGELSLNPHFQLKIGDDPTGTPYDGGHLPAAPGPGFTNFTFEAKVAISSLPEGFVPAFYLGATSYPYELYVNGQMLYKSGRHDELNYNSNTYSGAWVVLPPSLLAKEGDNLVSLVAWPRGESSPLDSVVLTSSDSASSQAFWKTFFETNLIQCSQVVALMMGVYFLILMLFGHADDRRYLYFALLCLGFTGAYMNMSLNHHSSNQLLLEKISRVTFPFTVTFLSLFVVEFTSVMRRKLLPAWILGGLSLVSALAVIIQPDQASVSAVFGWSMNVLITPCLLFALALLVIDAIRRRRVDTFIVLAAFFILIGGSLWDISFVNSGAMPYLYLVPYCFMVMIMGVFFVLAFEQTALSRLASAQSAEIIQKGARLDQLLERISQAARELAASNDEFTQATTQSKAIIEDYRQSNEQIARDVFAKFEQIQGLMSTVNERLAESAQKIPAAVRDQSEAVRQVTETMGQINTQYGSIMQIAGDTNAKAQSLSANATKGTEVIAASTASIIRVAEESKVLREILTAIEDIANRTNILSINASIEAARAGESGRGFKVIAMEINQLASQSTSSLAASSDRMNQMQENIKRSSTQSEELRSNLGGIIHEATASAGSIESIVDLLKHQKLQSDQIGVQIQRLYDSSRSILGLVENDQAGTRDVSETIRSLQSSLGGIASLLDGQQERSDALTQGMRRLEEASARSLQTAAVLLELSVKRS